MKVKTLETMVMEKNAMIKVLQKRAFEKSEEEAALGFSNHDTIQNPNSLILHSKQISQSHFGSPSHNYSGLHAPQLSTPVPLSMSGSSPTKFHGGHVQDFFEGISTSMSSTARGPLTKLSVHGARGRSGSPAHAPTGPRSITPSTELMRSNRTTTPTRSTRRDSAPGGVSETDSAGPQDRQQPLTKMSFAPMKEEFSRTLPSKGYPAGHGSDTEEQAAERHTEQEKTGGRERTQKDRSDQSNLSLDSSLTIMDDTVNSSILNRSSLMEALKQEKETRPESYWRV